jgi:hypothetical protein
VPVGHPRRAGRLAGRTLGADQVVLELQGPVAESARPPRGSRRPGDRYGDRRSWCGRTRCPPKQDTMKIAANPSDSRGKMASRGTRIPTRQRIPVHRERTYGENGRTTVENQLGDAPRAGDTAGMAPGHRLRAPVRSRTTFRSAKLEVWWKKCGPSGVAHVENRCILPPGG